MKQTIILLLMLMSFTGLTSSYSESGRSKDEPKITFKQRRHDFGTIKEADGKVSCEFTFTNTGKAPLVIITATAGCGCTQPEFDDQPVAPGQSSAIKVTYNPKGRPGEFNKNINVRTNDPAQKKVVLTISGLVVGAGK